MRALVLVLAGATLLACSPKPAAPPPAPAPTDAGVAPPVVAITAADYAFTMPDTVPSGWVLMRVSNQGKELHHVQLIRFEPGKTIADFAKLPKPELPAWAVAMGGPNGAAPNASTEAFVRLEPGNYAAICVIPSADGKPHLIKGMVKPFTVVESHQAATPAASDIAVTLTDYDFQLSQPISAGKHVLRVETNATQPHELVIAKLPPGKQPSDLLAWVDKQQGPPPIERIMGATSISKGEVNLLPIDLAPGDYALICFVPDQKDGKPHAVHGMMKQIKVL